MTTPQERVAETRARQRAAVIMKVRCGLLTAGQAAAALGLSRKSYYKWEQRGLAGLLQGLAPQTAGRPPQGPSAREAQLAQQVQQLQRECARLQQRLALKDLVQAMNDRSGTDREEKK